ncbi:MAG: CDGSH iron-sulfur domain-containing protein [Chloroflexales bacterium]|nr:CDGSH iron-sulfur domain-containing protein [Chloroflexales bacterium]
MADSPRRYTSDAIDVTYDAKRCIHAAECVRGLPAVFDTAQKPWVQPESAAANEVAAVVLRCPTGALHFERKDGGAAESAPVQNTLAPVPNGPYFVRGNVQITDAAGNLIIADTRIALCRCGQSNNKPFCDNAHQQAGFVDVGAVTDNQAEVAATAAHTQLPITALANGPLFLQGDFELCSADGQSVFRGNKTALCRCGSSAGKPFCDGTHKEIGFQD